MNQIRIILEAEAVMGILLLCNRGQVKLLSSEALLFEVEKNPLPIRKNHAYAVLAKATTVAKVTAKIRIRAEELVEYGIKPLDALHLALAESKNVDYFCTCDDKLLRNSKQIENYKVRVLNPIELVQELDR